MAGIDEIMRVLREDNPRRPEAHLQIVGDALVAYYEARAEIERKGQVVVHPRTGAPMDNPYRKVLAAAAAALLKVDGVKSDQAARLLSEAPEGR